jgi:hypothetical protein
MFETAPLARTSAEEGDRHMSEESLEAPEADAVEQETDALRTPDDSADALEDVPLEADPADVMEQTREMGPDDTEDYR